MTAFPIDEAVFLGRLTAGATHEIRNVLSVVKESAGLMGDLLDRCGNEPFPHKDKFRKMITNILGQVDRGSVLMKGLNTLAHATDDRMRSVDVNQVLESQSVLCARFGRLKGIALTTKKSTPKAYVVTDPVVLHCAVCAVMDLLLEWAPPGSEISMGCEPDGDRLAIKVTLTRPEGSSREDEIGEGTGETLLAAQGMAEALGGSVEVRHSEGWARLTLPLRGGPGAPA